MTRTRWRRQHASLKRAFRHPSTRSTQRQEFSTPSWLACARHSGSSGNGHSLPTAEAARQRRAAATRATRASKSSRRRDRCCTTVHSSKTTSSPSGSRSGVNGNTSIRSMTIQSLHSNWLGLYPAAELHLSLRIATPGWQAAGPQLAADPGATLLRSLQHQHRAARSDRTARSRAQPKRALTAGSTARSAEGRRRALTFFKPGVVARVSEASCSTAAVAWR